MATCISHSFSDGSAIRFRIGAPSVEGESLPAPVFEGNRANCGGLLLERSVRPLPGGLAVSLRLRNDRNDPVRLLRLTPFLVEETDGFPDADALAEWRVFRMARQKNCSPGFFRPAVPDAAMEDVTFDTSEAVAGRGVTAADGDGGKRLPCHFSGDPGLVLETGAGQSPLLLAFVGQDLHLNEVRLETDPQRSRVERIEASALFDGSILAPGESVRTHDFVIRPGTSVPALLDCLTEDVADLYGVPPPPTRRPIVFCSWYFYGEDFVESDLHENLRELRERRIPCDVVQVDHGWMDRFGDWRANERFPAGLRAMAEAIRSARFTPGIWTAPFVLEPGSDVLRAWPDLSLRDPKGHPCIFQCARGACHVLDPYAPHAGRYLSDLYARLVREGFRYHKLDFVRSLVLHPEARFHDPSKTRAQAYRHALAQVRAAIGPEGYVEVCGGLYEGSAGLADAARSGRDVQGRWRKEDTRMSDYLLRIRQNVGRSHYNRLWHTDPDALQLRRREEPFRGNTEAHHLSMGVFTEEEAFTIVVNAFLGGGLACFSERLQELDADRQGLLRHVLPQMAPPARDMDPDREAYCPGLFVTFFDAPDNGLAPWRIVTLLNGSDETREMRFLPADAWSAGREAATPAQTAVFEFREQRFVGVLPSGSDVTVAVPAHASRCLRLTAWTGEAATLIGTDLNLSQGGELSAWSVEGRRVRGTRRMDWDCALGLTLLLPGATPALRRVEVPAGSAEFVTRESELAGEAKDLE